MLRIALTFIQFFSALAIIGLVMLQRGKGAEAGAGFGAGASGTVFGARGAGTALSRATAIFTAVFMLNSLALGYVGSHQTEQPKSIFDTAGQTHQAPVSPALPGITPGATTPAGSAGAGTNAPAAGTRGQTPGTPPASSPGARTSSAPQGNSGSAPARGPPAGK